MKKASVTKSITKLSKLYPKVGRLNGWLSDHAHWGYDAHIKTILDVAPGHVMKASSLFKGASYIALVAYSDVFVKTISEELGEYVAWEVVSKELDVSGNIAGFNFESEYEYLRKILLPFYPDISNLG